MYTSQATKIFLSCGIWNMEDQFFIKLSRVIAFKIYYVFFNLMTLQLDNLPDLWINFHLFEIWNKSLLDVYWTQSDDRRATCDISGSLPIPPIYPIKTRKIRHQDLGNMRLNITLCTKNGCVQMKRW